MVPDLNEIPCNLVKSTESKDYNTAKYGIKITKCSDISNGYTVLLQGRSVNDVCIMNGVIYMYKTVNLKTKLFTKLTNQIRMMKHGR